MWPTHMLMSEEAFDRWRNVNDFTVHICNEDESFESVNEFTKVILTDIRGPPASSPADGASPLAFLHHSREVQATHQLRLMEAEVAGAQSVRQRGTSQISVHWNEYFAFIYKIRQSTLPYRRGNALDFKMDLQKVNEKYLDLNEFCFRSIILIEFRFIILLSIYREVSIVHVLVYLNNLRDFIRMRFVSLTIHWFKISSVFFDKSIGRWKHRDKQLSKVVTKLKPLKSLTNKMFLNSNLMSNISSSCDHFIKMKKYLEVLRQERISSKNS